MKSLPMFLPLFALLSAFTLDQSAAGVRVAVQTLFLPVALPVRAVGQSLYERVVSPVDRFNLQTDSPKTLPEALYQNRVLLSRLTSAEAQVEDLRSALAQYGSLPAGLKKSVEAATVLGSSTDGRQTMLISTASLTRIEPEMAVVHPLGVVGKVLATSPAGGTAKVLLATDPAFRVDVRFARPAIRDDGVMTLTFLPMPAPLLAEGTGAGERDVQGTTQGLIAKYLPAAATRDLLKVGDAVLLDDDKFPASTRGLRIGSIRSIQIPNSSAGYASVEITPVAKLEALREVMVVNK